MTCENDTHEGGCLCGVVRYRVEGLIEWVGHCHCHSCRRSAGAVFVTWFTVERDRFAWTTGLPKQFASCLDVIREFCGDCGTDLAYSNERDAGSIDITLGSLDCAANHPADRHIWTADRLRWLHIDDHLPAHAGWSADE